MLPLRIFLLHHSISDPVSRGGYVDLIVALPLADMSTETKGVLKEYFRDEFAGEAKNVLVDTCGSRLYEYCKHANEENLLKELISLSDAELKARTNLECDQREDCIAMLLQAYKKETEGWKTRNKFRRLIKRGLLGSTRIKILGAT